MSDEQYPEHEKLHLIKDKSQALGEFIEWLPTIGIHLATWICPGHVDFHIPTLPEYFHEDPDDCDNLHLVYAHRSTESLLAEHFEIDLNTLESEKRAMLDAQRALNEQVQSHEQAATHTEENDVR